MASATYTCQRCEKPTEAIVVFNDRDLCLGCFDVELGEQVAPFHEALRKAGLSSE